MFSRFLLSPMLRRNSCRTVSHTVLGSQLKQVTDRLSPEAISLASSYSLAVRQASPEFIEKRDVQGGMDMWQESFDLIYQHFGPDEEKLEEKLQVLHCSEESITFLVEYARFFEMLSGPTQEFKDMLYKRRVLALSLVHQLYGVFPDDRKSDALANYVAGTFHPLGRCLFELKEYDEAYNFLSANAGYCFQLPFATKEEDEWTEEDVDHCMKYVIALLEAAAPLKALDKHKETLEVLKTALGLCEDVISRELALGRVDSPDGSEKFTTSKVTLELLGNLLTNIAMRHCHLNEHKEGLPFFRKALKVYEQFPPSDEKDKSMGVILDNIVKAEQMNENGEDV